MTTTIETPIDPALERLLDEYGNNDELETLIAPDILASDDWLAFGGPARTDKSHLMLSWLMHMAVGKSFLGMTPQRPLRVAYFQADDGISNSQIRDRMGRVKLDSGLEPVLRRNFAAFANTAKFDAKGLKEAQRLIDNRFWIKKPDIIAIDPVDNVLSYGRYDTQSSALANLLNQLWGANLDSAIVLVSQNARTRVILDQEHACIAITMRKANRGGCQLIFYDRIVKDIELIDDQWCEVRCTSVDQKADDDFGQLLDGPNTNFITMSEPDPSTGEARLSFKRADGSLLAPKYIKKIEDQWAAVERASPCEAN